MSYINFTEEEHDLIKSVYSKVNTLNKKAFLSIIRNNELENGWASVPLEEFRSLTHISIESITRTLKILEKHGVITIRKYRPKGSYALYNQYKINTPDDILALHKAKQP